MPTSCIPRCIHTWRGLHLADREFLVVFHSRLKTLKLHYWNCYSCAASNGICAHCRWIYWQFRDFYTYRAFTVVIVLTQRRNLPMKKDSLQINCAELELLLKAQSDQVFLDWCHPNKDSILKDHIFANYNLKLILRYICQANSSLITTVQLSMPMPPKKYSRS